MFAIASGLFYGLLGYFGVSLLKLHLTPLNISFWRFFISFLFLFIIVMSRKTRLGSARDMFSMLLNGGMFYSAPSTLFLVASKYISTGQSMVIFFTFPAFVMILRWIFEKEPIRAPYFISFGIILIGLVLLVDIAEFAFDFLGMALSLLSAISYAFYIFFGKRVRLPAHCSSMMVCLGASSVCGLLALIDGSFSLPTGPMPWLHLIGMGVICTALPILFMFEALGSISADKASLLSVLEPVFVVIFGILLLGEVLYTNALIGIILVLLGTMTVSTKEHLLSALKLRKA